MADHMHKMRIGLYPTHPQPGCFFMQTFDLPQGAPQKFGFNMYLL